MKTRTQTRISKLVSLLLTFVMLLGMIPAGAINVFATGTYPDDGNLIIDANATEYVIKGPVDWQTVSTASANGNTFAGKVIKLGVSLAGNQTTPLELPTLFPYTTFTVQTGGYFQGEFDGCGNTVSYVNVTGNALISYGACGIAAEGTDAKIHDVNLDNINLTAANSNGTGIVVGICQNVSGAGDDTIITNVNVTNSTVNAGTYATTSAMVGTVAQGANVKITDCNISTNTTVKVNSNTHGLLFGSVSGVVYVKGTNVEGKISSGNQIKANLGGLVGYAAATKYAGITLDFSNCSLNVTIECTATNASSGSDRTADAGLAFGEIRLFQGCSAKTSSTIKLDGCKVSGTISGPYEEMGGIVGMFCGNYKEDSGSAITPDFEFAVTNTAVNATLTNTVTSSFSMTPPDVRWSMGGLIGGYYGYSEDKDSYAANGSILFENVKVEGAITSQRGAAMGGVIGNSFGSRNLASGMTTDITVRNCEITPTLTNNMSAGAVGVGMVIGRWGVCPKTLEDESTLTYYYHTGTVTIEKSLIAGTIKAPNIPNSLGAVIGFMGYRGTTVNIDNCAITTDFPVNEKINTSDTKKSAAAIVGRTEDCEFESNINVNNCVTSYAGKAGTDFCLVARVHEIKFNGNNATGLNVYSDDCLLYVSSEKLGDMVKRQDVTVCGETVSMIKRIGGHITGGYLQITDIYSVKPETGSIYTAYAIRFIALSQLEAPTNAGITVVVKDANGNTVKTFDTLMCETYDSLIGYGPDGAQLDAYDASKYDYGASKFIAVVIEDIPTGTAYTFEVTPHYVTEGGLTVTGETRTAEINANGILTNAIG